MSRASDPSNPAMSLHKGTSGHLSHCDNSGKRKKKGGVVGGKQKNKKSTNPENNSLKKKQRPHNALPNVIPNTGSCYTEAA